MFEKKLDIEEAPDQLHMKSINPTSLNANLTKFNVSKRDLAFYRAIILQSPSMASLFLLTYLFNIQQLDILESTF
ncbi:TPA: hypothetical protein DDW35_00115 [Candidatus Sumerlaeota bacterium]|jgi:hypothetical protein|nr:hypothetical protein [Candidatus Sumerlaeota bacterium]